MYRLHLALLSTAVYVVAVSGIVLLSSALSLAGRIFLFLFASLCWFVQLNGIRADRGIRSLRATCNRDMGRLAAVFSGSGLAIWIASYLVEELNSLRFLGALLAWGVGGVLLYGMWLSGRARAAGIIPPKGSDEGEKAKPLIWDRTRPRSTRQRIVIGVLTTILIVIVVVQVLTRP